MTVLAPHIDAVHRLQPRAVIGSVSIMRGLSLYVDHFAVPIGTLVGVCRQRRASSSADVVRGEVVGFDRERSIIMLFDEGDGIAPGDEVVAEPRFGAPTIDVAESFLGRVINVFGQPIDGGHRLVGTTAQLLHPPPISAMHRRRITEPLPTGLRVIDAFTTLGKGQRVGVFSAAGVGKSTIVGSIARNTSADVNVIALIGERGREVRDFIEISLGKEGLARSVIVVATGDQSPLLRVRAALAACAVAEFFRDRGADVMLMMDSITRFAQAQRQIGLAIGEQPATKGYTPSVFAMLPTLLERAGAIEGSGSITGLYAVLVEGDDLNEPISDAARGVLDGHLVLSRKLAARAHYPALNPLESISRVADDVCDRHHIAARQVLLKLMAAYADAEELINIGAYARGSNPMCDTAIAMKPAIDAFLQQGRGEKSDFPYICKGLLELSTAAQHDLAQRHGKPSNVSPKPHATKK